jgi:ankyrin repeat protein
VIPLLPIELLISWNDSDIFELHKHVLLSYNFRKTLASKVARFGNYQTMMWFQSNGLTFNESVLVSAAQRGDVQLFDSIWNDRDHRPLRVIDLTNSTSLRLDAFKGAAQFGQLDLLKYAQCTSKLRLDNTDDAITVLQAASKHGHLNILKWYIEQNKAPFSFEQTDKMISAAVVGNKMNVLVWLKSVLDVQSSWELFVRVSVHFYVSLAARHDNKKMVMWLIDNGFHSDMYSAVAAAYAGSIDLLSFFSPPWSEHVPPWSEHVYTNAAKKGHLALLQWAKANAGNNYPWPVSKMFPAAANCDNVELYQWLFDQQFPFEEETSFITALKKGHFKLIKFARSHGSTFWNDEFYFSLLERAASLGDLETMKWAIAENTGTTGTAAANHPIGANHPIRWNHLMEASRDFFVPVIEAAASRGHIYILEYLRPRPYFWEPFFYSKVSRVAARHGHVAILEWVSANTFCISPYGCFKAAIRGSQFKVLVWLKTHFPMLMMKGSHLMLYRQPMLLAAQVGDIEVFKWLRNNGMKWHPLTYAVAKQFFHYDIAEWALKNGCPKDKHSRGRFSFTKAKRLELSVYVKVDEPSQEEEVDEEAEVIVVQEENEDDEQEDEVVEDEEVEDDEVAVDEEDVFSLD